jgi:hypothetical protein
VKPKNCVDIPGTIEIVAGEHYYFEYRYNGSESEDWKSEFGDVFDSPVASYSVSDGRSYFRKLYDNSQLKFPKLNSRMLIEDTKNLVVDVYAMDSAMGTFTSDADGGDVVMYSDVVPEIGDFCLITKLELGEEGITRTTDNQLYTIMQVGLMDPACAKYHVWFDKDVPFLNNGVYEFAFLKGPANRSRAVIGSVEGNTAKCRYWYEDIYTADYWMPSDGSYLLKCAYKDEFNDVIRIKEFVPGNGYKTGDMVYWPLTKSIYRVTKPISGSESESELIEKGAVVPYMYTVADIARKPIYNDYMEGIFRTSQLEYGETVDIDQ